MEGLWKKIEDIETLCSKEKNNGTDTKRCIQFKKIRRKIEDDFDEDDDQNIDELKETDIEIMRLEEELGRQKKSIEIEFSKNLEDKEEEIFEEDNIEEKIFEEENIEEEDIIENFEDENFDDENKSNEDEYDDDEEDEVLEIIPSPKDQLSKENRQIGEKEEISEKESESEEEEEEIEDTKISPKLIPQNLKTEIKNSPSNQPNFNLKSASKISENHEEEVISQEDSLETMRYDNSNVKSKPENFIKNTKFNSINTIQTFKSNQGSGIKPLVPLIKLENVSNCKTDSGIDFQQYLQSEKKIVQKSDEKNEFILEKIVNDPYETLIKSSNKKERDMIKNMFNQKEHVFMDFSSHKKILEPKFESLKSEKKVWKNQK